MIFRMADLRLHFIDKADCLIAGKAANWRADIAKALPFEIARNGHYGTRSRICGLSCEVVRDGKSWGQGDEGAS